MADLDRELLHLQMRAARLDRALRDDYLPEAWRNVGRARVHAVYLIAASAYSFLWWWTGEPFQPKWYTAPALAVVAVLYAAIAWWCRRIAVRETAIARGRGQKARS